MGFLDGRNGESYRVVGWEGRAEERESPAFSSSQSRYFFQPGTQGIPSHGYRSQSLCVSTETRLGMLQAIRGNVMPQWEF